MEKARVYFTRDLTPQGVIKMYEALGTQLTGNIAIKIHSGEAGNQNYLRPDFMKPMVEYLGGTVVENNTAYGGKRNTTEKHLKLLKEHGWLDEFKFDLLDEEDNDIVLDIPNGKVIKKDYIGGHTSKYDSMLILSHFKGHPMGGFGGALKQLSIGCASSRGKAYIHSAGKSDDQYTIWGDLPEQDLFLESMADSASAVTKYFREKQGILFINTMKNMSVDCDCCAVAEDPCIQDIGILSSTDPIALDQACLDLIINSNDPGKEHFMKRVNSRHGIHTIEAAAELGFGTREYELITID